MPLNLRSFMAIWHWTRDTRKLILLVDNGWKATIKASVKGTELSLWNFREMDSLLDSEFTKKSITANIRHLTLTYGASPTTAQVRQYTMVIHGIDRAGKIIASLWICGKLTTVCVGLHMCKSSCLFAGVLCSAFHIGMVDVIFRQQGRKIGLTVHYFPSVQTENNTHIYAILRPYGRKINATICYFPSLQTENSIWLHPHYFPSVALSSKYRYMK